MGKLQYDSFYKFIVSLGMVLIALPILAFYFFMQKTNDFIITEEEYVKLSSFSLEFINKRNEILQLFLRFFPIICIVFVISGISLFFNGLYKWRKIQKEYDEQICIKTKKERKELEKMTPTEIVEKKLEEVEEEFVESKRNSYRANIVKALQIENLWYAYLQKNLPSYYRIEQNVKTKDTHFDMVATSLEKDILYEVRYWKQYPDTQKFECCYRTFKENCFNYEQNISKKVEGILVIVCPLEEFDKTKMHCKSQEERLDLVENIKIQYFSEEDLSR